MLPKTYANIANVRNTNIKGIVTNPSNPSVKFVAFVEPITINRIRYLNILIIIVIDRYENNFNFYKKSFNLEKKIYLKTRIQKKVIAKNLNLARNNLSINKFNEKIIIDANYVKNNVNELSKDTDLSKFIL